MMADVRCPKCGSRTTILTAKKDDCQYHVCINRPRCGGRVLADEDQGDGWDKARSATKTTHDSTRQRIKLYCPECGAETTLRTAKKDDCQYHVCVNSSRCRGRVLADEDQGDDWGDDWGKESHVFKSAPVSTRQRVKPYHPERGAGTVIRRPGKDKHEFDVGVKRHESKGKLAFDEVWSDDWGHDWDEDKPAPKTVPYRPQYPRAQKRQVASEVKEPPKPRRHKAPKAAHEEPRPQKAPKPA